MSLRQFACCAAGETFHSVCLLREDCVITGEFFIWVWHKRSVYPSLTFSFRRTLGLLQVIQIFSFLLTSFSPHPFPLPWSALYPQPSFLFWEEPHKVAQALNLLCSPARTWTCDLPALVSSVSRITFDQYIHRYCLLVLHSSGSVMHAVF